MIGEAREEALVGASDPDERMLRAPSSELEDAEAKVVPVDDDGATSYHVHQPSRRERRYRGGGLYEKYVRIRNAEEERPDDLDKSQHGLERRVQEVEDAMARAWEEISTHTHLADTVCLRLR